MSTEEEIEARLEWEERQESVPMRLHMVAGSCAGVAEHLLMFPIDTYKVCCEASKQGPITFLAPLKCTRPYASSLSFQLPPNTNHNHNQKLIPLRQPADPPTEQQWVDFLH